MQFKIFPWHFKTNIKWKHLIWFACKSTEYVTSISRCHFIPAATFTRMGSDNTSPALLYTLQKYSPRSSFLACSFTNSLHIPLSTGTLFLYHWKQGAGLPTPSQYSLNTEPCTTQTGDSDWQVMIGKSAKQVGRKEVRKCTYLFCHILQMDKLRKPSRKTCVEHDIFWRETGSGLGEPVGNCSFQSKTKVKEHPRIKNGRKMNVWSWR